MGSGASKQAPRGLVLSFDALGTLYRFKSPAPQQFLSVAKQCGYKGKTTHEELNSSYLVATRYMQDQHPNYGKKTLESTEEWWAELARYALRVPDTQKVPGNLGPSLYKHFSSGAAYELYPDVKPFLQHLHHHRRMLDTGRKSDPMLILGIITNSDQGVRRVLQNLGLSVGTSEDIRRLSLLEIVKEGRNRAKAMPLDDMKMWYDIWSLRHDSDFLVTSYDEGYEKPDPRPFRSALSLAEDNIASRAEQLKQLQWKAGTKAMMKGGLEVIGHARKMDLAWIHVGDDYDKDYVGATDMGHDAFHLIRQGTGKEPVEGARTIASLVELVPIINLMVQQDLLAPSSSTT